MSACGQLLTTKMQSPVLYHSSRDSPHPPLSSPVYASRCLQDLLSDHRKLRPDSQFIQPTNGVQVALVATIPWDSHLIHTRIWTYPPNVIIGPTLFDIPAEEVFFFVIQTYITSLLYLIVSKPTFHPVYLRGGKAQDRFKWRTWCWVGQATLAGIILVGAKLVSQKKEGLYMGLILVWATPVLLFLWYVFWKPCSCSGRLKECRSIAYQFLIGLPLTSTLLPIALPTVYLWVIDTMALNRGTWAIESGTKLNWHLWDGLDIESVP